MSSVRLVVVPVVLVAALMLSGCGRRGAPELPEPPPTVGADGKEVRRPAPAVGSKPMLKDGFILDKLL